MESVLIKNNMELQFDEKKHLYTLEDKPITGVTTILKVINKPALLQWSSNMAVEHIEREVAKIASENDNLEYMKELAKKWATILKDAKTAYRRKADKAADIGSLAHAWVEKYINAKIKGEKEPEREEALALMTDNFVKWVDENKVKFLSSEQRVFSKKHWYAGTYDFDCEIDGKVYIGDLKTSSGIYSEMFFQTAAYQCAAQEMNEPNEVPIQGNIIVNCKKDGKFDWQISEEYHQNLSAFMGALAIYRRNGELGLN